MSGSGPGEEPHDDSPNPFQGIFGDLARLLGAQHSGPLNWEVARQVAVLIAGEGATEANPDPLERIKLENLARVAQLHVERISGITVPITSVEALNHVDWTLRTLDDYRSLLEPLAASLGKPPEINQDEINDGPSGEAANSPFAGIEKFLTPILLAMQVGGMIGHLSRRSLTALDLPVPRERPMPMMLIPSNIDAFADDWSLPREELGLYLAIEETVRISILQHSHVREHITRLILQYVSSFRPDYSSLHDQLTELEINDPSEIPTVLSDPNAILGAIQSPEQQPIMAQLNAVIAALLGYVDFITNSIAPGLIRASSAIAEAAKRRRVEESEGVRLVTRLLGLEMTQSQFDRGDAFINGVIERAGTESLQRLWTSPKQLPTPAEMDAPGLWLARIDLMS